MRAPAGAAAEALGVDAAVGDNPTVARGVTGALIRIGEAAHAVEQEAPVEKAARAERSAGLPVDGAPRSATQARHAASVRSQSRSAIVVDVANP